VEKIKIIGDFLASAINESRRFHLVSYLLFTVAKSTTNNITGMSEYPQIHNPDSNPPILWIDKCVMRFKG